MGIISVKLFLSLFPKIEPPLKINNNVRGSVDLKFNSLPYAFGMETCKRYFNTKYVRLSDLLIDLEIAKSEGNYRKVMAKYANPLVLILGEWLLLKPTEME